ncbi:MAG TPA: PEGA domain-containing protein [Gemmatales bacterium]|nr:PEGA domain-containing protein [Gemmatales bacterium]HMP61123.1 PEGA domain-containing protein [Gemmatales bacterium]
MGRGSIGLMGLVLVVAQGCVERRYLVVSDPPGAMLVVNRQEVGPTPVTLPTNSALFYGDYDFLLFKDGYEPLTVKQPIPAPWWQWFPFDLITEHLWPGTLIDERTFAYQLSPAPIVPPETLLQVAQSARSYGAGVGPVSPMLSAPVVPNEQSPPVNPRP